MATFLRDVSDFLPPSYAESIYHQEPSEDITEVTENDFLHQRCYEVVNEDTADDLNDRTKNAGRRSLFRLSTDEASDYDSHSAKSSHDEPWEQAENIRKHANNTPDSEKRSWTKIAGEINLRKSSDDENIDDASDTSDSSDDVRWERANNTPDSEKRSWTKIAGEIACRIGLYTGFAFAAHKIFKVGQPVHALMYGVASPLISTVTDPLVDRLLGSPPTAGEDNQPTRRFITQLALHRITLYSTIYGLSKALNVPLQLRTIICLDMYTIATFVGSVGAVVVAVTVAAIFIIGTIGLIGGIILYHNAQSQGGEGQSPFPQWNFSYPSPQAN